MTANALPPRWQRMLRSPWAIIAGIVLGGLFGLALPQGGSFVSPLARIYLGLLRMCILPIMVTAIVSGLGRLVRTPGATSALRRLALTVVIGALTASAIGLAAGLLFAPGAAVSEQSRASLGRMLHQADQMETPQAGKAARNASDFFVSMVPENIFAALSQGHSLQILIFSLLLGVALGMVKLPAAGMMLELLDSLCEAFKKIIAWFMYALPLGLFCIFADFVSSTGLGIFETLGRFILAFICGCSVIFAVNLVVIWQRTRQSLPRIVAALRETLLVALSTSNGFIAIPPALREAEKGLGLSHAAANLVIPLSVVINRQGVVLAFSLTIVLLAQLYGVTLGPEALSMALFGAALAGTAALGRLGIASGLLAFVLQPLGLPVETAFIVLVSVEVLFEPLTALLAIFPAVTTAAVIDAGPGKQP